METSVLVWGLVAIAGGIFVAVYGYVLYRMVLASAGLMIGFYIGMRLTLGQPDFMRLLVAVLIGGGLALAFYTFYKLGFYIAGGIVGSVLGMIAIALFGVEGTAALAVVVVLAIVGGVMGRWLGELIIISATSLLGAYAIIYGIATLFPDKLTNAETGRIAMSSFNFTVLICIILVSALAQFQMRRGRGRLLDT